ncbi:class I SAM-dependent methyltransferase [Streptomyces barringtoniae]|uniref:class I SAM-dependent methyltransferase n=1 Tax=Streptomyces barringtoniae TaxID=2892029 RepID=UPI001E4334E6|nr:class I SAM-dependent methyltransferase [Streptomyces barringtoniae]MCC5476346.1 class I SAM-dependent methyltransferase [Streptomyces barringtoniae]
MAHDHQAHHGHSTQHGHGHTHGGDVDWAAIAELMEAEAEVCAPVYARALAWLGKEVTEPGLIVDAGSGPGVIACLMADTFPGARVVAADASEPLLERARARAARQGVADRFGTIAGELPDSLGELAYPADLLWASRSLHHLGDQKAALAAFAARLAPGGTLAILEGGLPSRYLPRDIGFGRPGLQARLDAAQEERFARMRAELPGAVPETEDWPALLTAAGLKHTGTRSFLLDIPAPVPDRARAFVVGWLTRTRDIHGDVMDAEDRATLDRLLDPADPGGLHRRPDVFVLSAHTVHRAVRPV